MSGVTLGKMHLLIWCVILVNTFTYRSTDTTRVFLSDNGYSNVLVAIASGTPRNQAQTIIDNIKVIRYSEWYSFIYRIDWFPRWIHWSVVLSLCAERNNSLRQELLAAMVKLKPLLSVHRFDKINPEYGTIDRVHDNSGFHM